MLYLVEMDEHLATLLKNSGQIKIHEAIKGWKHAGRDINKSRQRKSDNAKSARLVVLKKDGAESKMHDATSLYSSEEEARAKHADIVRMNPGRRIAHNLYVDDELIDQLVG